MNKMDYKLLNLCFKDKESIFSYFATKGKVLDCSDLTKRRVFIDNGGSVLFVGHLDTVLPPKIHKMTANTIVAQGLDDRLGLYVILTLLKSGVKADVLLTDGEESAKSTAKYHNLKNYNWVCEFDRGGTDFVSYGLANKDLKNILSQTWPEGVGSFTDICFFKTEIACFNLGIGYHQAHGKNSYVKIMDVENQIEKFKTFYVKNSGIAFKQDGTDFDNWLSCDVCGSVWEVKPIHGYNVCKDCIEKFIGIADNPVRCDNCGGERCASYDENSDSHLCTDCREYIYGAF